MDDQESIFPEPDILWNAIREAERTASEDQPIVLVVDDDPSSRMIMRYAVKDIVRTDAAGTVEDALRMAETVPYDGLLVDLELPDGEGTQVVSDLRERTPYWGIPMVAVTAHRLPKKSGSFLNAGFDAYVAKPFEKEDLRTLVHHLVVEPDDAIEKGRKLVHRDSATEGDAASEGEAGEQEREGDGVPETEELNMPSNLKPDE